MVPAVHPSLHFDLFYFKLSAVSLLGREKIMGRGLGWGVWSESGGLRSR